MSPPAPPARPLRRPPARPLRRPVSAVRLVVWAAVLVAVLAGLHRLGRGALAPPPLGDLAQLRSWAGARGPTTVGFALVRLGAVVLAWYLLATMVAGGLARALGLVRTARAVEMVSLPAIRRLVGALATMSLSTAALAGPVAASPAPGRGREAAAGVAAGMPRTGVVGAPAARTGGRVGGRQPGGHARPGTGGPAPTKDRMEPVPALGGGPLPVMRLDGPVPAPAAPASPAPPTPPGGLGSGPVTTWTVRPGDNFWAMAETTLRRAWGRPADDAEVDHYWTGLVAANRDRLAHPELPDLIFPGQVFVMLPAPAPPPGGVGRSG